jgi:integrase
MSVLSLAELHVMYQKEHFNMHKDDRRHTAKAFSIISEILPDHNTETFFKFHFFQFRNELIRRQYDRSYCNKLMSRIKAVFKWAATYDLCSMSSYQSLLFVEPVKYGEARENQKRTDVDDMVVYETLKFLPQMVRDMVIFLRVTGMRPSEVCRMKIGDIHSLPYDGRTFWVCELKEHKTARFGKPRIIPLNDRALEILNPYVFESESPPDNLVFCTEGNHVPWSVDRWGKMIALTIQEHKLPKWTLYQLRHTKATELSIQEGVEVAADVLGNSVEVMSRIYDHGKTARLFRSLSVNNSPPE